MMHSTTRLSLTILLFAALACGRSEQPAPGSGTPQSGRAGGKTITIKGSDTMVILGQRFAEEYMKANAGSTVQVNGGGSGTGIAALINGTVDLAQSSRPMKDKERADVEKNRNATLVETAVALDALAVFVHATNPVRELSIEQLAAIYTGKTTNWKDVGGNDAPMVLYGRENSSGTYEYFKEHVLNKADFAPRTQTLQGTAAVINAVARDRNGIGYGGIAYAKDVRAIAVKATPESPGVAPSEATVADNSYPISRKLFFYHLSTASPELQKFVAWVVGPAGQELVKNVGYFPLATQPLSTTSNDATTTATTTTSATTPSATTSAAATQ